MRNILIINGHPNKDSYNYSLSKAYQQGLEQSGVKYDQINIADLQFDPNLKYGYQSRIELEPDLKESLEKIQKADHLVWFFPMWWYGYPALMKGFVDRTFLPGITFKYEDGDLFPKKLLKGKTGHIVVTADTPGWYDRLIMGKPAIRQFKKGTLEFCGVSPVKVSFIAPIRNSSEAFRNKWINKIYQLGQRAT